MAEAVARRDRGVGAGGQTIYPLRWTSSSAILVAAVRRRHLHRLARAHGRRLSQSFHILLSLCSGTRRAAARESMPSTPARRMVARTHLASLYLDLFPLAAGSRPLQPFLSLRILLLVYASRFKHFQIHGLEVSNVRGAAQPASARRLEAREAATHRVAVAQLVLNVRRRQALTARDACPHTAAPGDR